MDYINLGKSDLKVSQLGFGCCPMGGYGWGVVSSMELERSVSMALDSGINLFDTADTYGFGESEKQLGKFLRGRRHEAIIATKFGVRSDSERKTFYDNSPAWIEIALEASLKRLNTDHIDLYQIHYFDGKTPFEDIINTLERKRNEGKVRYYGFSNVSCQAIEHYNLPKHMISFQSEYSLANRRNEKDIREITAEKSLGFISWGSLGQGILSGKYNSGTKFSDDDRRSRQVYVNFHGEKLEQNLKIVEVMREISEKKGRTLSQLAIRWIIDYLGFGVVLVGIKKQEQLADNMEAFGWHLDREEIDSLDAVSRLSRQDYTATR